MIIEFSTDRKPLEINDDYIDKWSLADGILTIYCKEGYQDHWINMDFVLLIKQSE